MFQIHLTADLYVQQTQHEVFCIELKSVGSDIPFRDSAPECTKCARGSTGLIMNQSLQSHLLSVSVVSGVVKDGRPADKSANPRAKWKGELGIKAFLRLDGAGAGPGSPCSSWLPWARLHVP